ncbi:MAG TPA: histidinol dehydrogenase, partial [Chryseolinea sp.]|nr:histidinol dehydrogenase [Chryseolinea sp.]
FLDSTVKNVLNRVRKSGDQALRDLTLQYDKVDVTDLQVTKAEFDQAEQALSRSLKDAIQQAAANIEIFHEAQRRETVRTETTPGVVCWRKAVPIQKVGIYIPGGSAPLFSTVLMLGIPAKLAGCKHVVLCSPPDKSGNINDAILFAAKLVGIKTVYKVGGAQAIGAMAFGTETIGKVFKIFGPGNQYVTKAKQLVMEDGVATDMPAGPSEVLVMADAEANPVFVASDLLSQAEHGEDSQVILLVDDESLVPPIQQAIDEQLKTLPRKKIAERALLNSRVIVMNDIQKALEFVNEYAPEHLIINMRNAEQISHEIVNAGSVFLGNYSPEAIGDYASGTNHTLPTNGYAKAFAGVSLESFMKYITYQQLSAEGIKNLGPVVEEMAEAEQLMGHKMAVRVRLDSFNQQKGK